MKKYDQCLDQELLIKIRSGDDEAMEYLMEKYRGLVRTEARKFFLTGGDEEDLIQEGMIGLFKAVRSYQEERDAAFSTFATICVRRQIYSTVTASNRKKHGPLNNYISIFGSFTEENGKLNEVLEDSLENPEELLLRKEKIRNYYDIINEKLSDYEKQVMEHYLNGDDYTQIAKKLGRTDKSIDNAIQRIRRKLNQDS
ncbi:RNA polymerase subunit sigma-70 [Anaerostipes sp. 494a]|uniref:sigma-70 family RNA polymerase sigma factor n=1 Tax=Anaerostipes sp. 494a TaxID=1261636 RepID=UPI000952A3BB|nr:sigma-70 family RNA polymerase sigma factor [Anaerostipes sp. 494a]OLR58749.1 RNA polymerase subunit sigma-70 [Anaerostipes sp. 494a]